MFNSENIIIIFLKYRLTSFIKVLFYLFVSAIIACKSEPPEAKIFIGPDQKQLSMRAVYRNKIPLNQIGYILYDIDKKKTICSHNRRKPLIPSSTTKLLTTAAALNTLGPDYQFKTYLCYTGKIDSGTLIGDLYLKGTGDPLLRVPNLISMIDALKECGIKKIRGNFYYDESELISSNKIDNIMNADAAYNPGVSALSLDFNVVYAHWEPYKKKKIKKEMKNKIEKIFLIPSLPINRITVSKDEYEEKRKFKFKKIKGREKWFLSARIAGKRKTGKKRLPVKNPGLYTAVVFSKLCRFYGIKVLPPKPKTLPENHHEIFVHKGISLLRLAEITLLYSNNLMAELILLRTARKITGKALNFEQSAGVLEEYFSDRMTKIDWKGLYLNNGSGLTSDNRITPEQLLAVLLYANSYKYKRRSFLSLLPISGWRGSLFRRLNKPETAFRVWAKTGSINYAISLAGYLFTKSNRKMLFVIIISDEKNRKYFDDHPYIRFKKRTRNAVYRWSRKNKKAIDDILAEWIDTL